MSVCSFCGCCLTGGVAIGIGLALVFPPDPAAVGTDGAVAELAGPGGRDRDVPAGRVVGGGTAGFAESFLPLLEADDHYGIGLLLDKWLGTTPWLLLLFFLLGSAAGIMNVFRVAGGHDSSVGYRRDKAEDASKGRDDGNG